MGNLQRRIVAISALTAIIGTIGAVDVGSAMASSYPAPIVSSFVTSCEHAARATNKKVTASLASRYCNDALSCIESKLSLAQFDAVVLSIQARRPNANAKVLTTCEKSALKQVSK
jgi:hypothetical protein